VARRRSQIEQREIQKYVSRRQGGADKVFGGDIKMQGKYLKKFAFGSLAVMLATLGFATVIEKLFGTEAVHRYIYAAYWFVACSRFFNRVMLKHFYETFRININCLSASLQCF
jgi:hypothetical protein